MLVGEFDPKSSRSCLEDSWLGSQTVILRTLAVLMRVLRWTLAFLLRFCSRMGSLTYLRSPFLRPACVPLLFWRWPTIWEIFTMSAPAVLEPVSFETMSKAELCLVVIIGYCLAFSLFFLIVPHIVRILPATSSTSTICYSNLFLYLIFCWSIIAVTGSFSRSTWSESGIICLM